jgi:hypothetical protein
MRPAGQYRATSRMDIAQTVSDFSKPQPSPLYDSLDQLLFEATLVDSLLILLLILLWLQRRI